MKSFLKMLLASILGGGLLLFLIFIIFASLISISTPKAETKENSVLRIDLNTALVERAQNNPFSSFDPLSGQPQQALGLNAVIAGLQAAKNDSKIKGLMLSGGIPLADAASVKELRDALLDFKSSGKFIYGYAEILSQKGLYLATVADTFMVNPEGLIEFIGLSASVTYFKDALDKLGVKPVVLRATGNKFKSAVEPFLTNEMTAENRTQLTELLESVWATYLEEMAEQSNASINQMNSLADSFDLANPAKAAEAGLIELTGYQDEIDSLLAKRSGYDDIKDIPFVSLQKYAKAYDLNGNKGFNDNRVAVIIAQGSIQSGEGNEFTIGSSRIAKALRKARENDKVKAVVLRINSPGGSALASDVIWREVELTKRVKPVIASMGGVAASGGYYIACFADTIVAQPNTVTGSIGAFGLFFTAQELLNDKMGINIETVETNTLSDLGTPDRDLTPSEKRILIHQIDRVYNTFKSRVAEGRGFTMAYVDSIGQGRVYSGTAALELGLVDVLGGWQKAVQIAADKAGLGTDYQVVEYPEPVDPLMQFIEEFSSNYEARVLRNQLGPLAPYFKTLKNIETMQGIQTRMEYEIVID
jgi:protease-4